MPRGTVSESSGLRTVAQHLAAVATALQGTEKHLPAATWRSVIGHLSDAQMVIGWLERQVGEGVHRNPALIIHNPPRRRGNRIRIGQDEGELFGSEVEEIRYRHAEDSAWYKHLFEHPGKIHMYAMTSMQRPNWIAILGQQVEVWKEF